MSSELNSSRGCGFLITEQGHNAIDGTTACECVYVRAGALLMCDECGTVYGRLTSPWAPHSADSWGPKAS
jgi:hypothetical protein